MRAFTFMASHFRVPVSPEPKGPPDIARPIPAPPQPRRPSKPSPWLTTGLCLVAGVAIALMIWMLANRESALGSGPASTLLRTAPATLGEFTKSLRIGGTVETLQYAAIRAPRLRGPRDSGSSQLTLAMLAEPGTVIPAGSVVAEFDLQWLVDHIKDRESVQTVEESNARKRESEIMILKETERQARLAARAEADKADLDVGTAEVRSKIEAEILRNVAHEARATWQQLEEEGQFMEIVHSADLRRQQLEVREEELHTERHLRDLERLRVKTPIPGMVVLEATFKDKGGGLYAQTKPGDQVYPGSLFMRIVDVSKMVVNASVNQVDAQTIGIGDRAVIELDAYPGEHFEGRVIDLGAVATSSSGGSKYSRGGPSSFLKQIPVRILIESKDDRILPDLSASADIQYSGPQSGVIVPREAIRSEPGADGVQFVHVADNGTYHRRLVQVQDINDTEALVSSGLNSGEEVLLEALPETRDKT